MSLFEKGIAVWFVAIAAGGVWLYTSTDRQEAKAAATQPQPETQPPASGANIIPEAKAAVQAGLRDPDGAVRAGLRELGLPDRRAAHPAGHHRGGQQQPRAQGASAVAVADGLRIGIGVEWLMPRATVPLIEIRH